jgi:hypothetical protein
MNSRDFNYWLMGWFELEKPKVLTANRIAIIKQHLDMVFTYEKINDSSTYSFCKWLRGCVDVIETKTFNTKQTSIVFKELSAVFEHEIDNSFGDKKSELQQIHKKIDFLPPGMNYEVEKQNNLSYVTPAHTMSFMPNVEHQGQSVSMSYSNRYAPGSGFVGYDHDRKIMC